MKSFFIGEPLSKATLNNLSNRTSNFVREQLFWRSLFSVCRLVTEIPIFRIYNDFSDHKMDRK